MAGDPCPPRDVLETLAVGGARPRGVDAHLAGCESCRQALDRIRDDNRFLARYLACGAAGGAPPQPPALIDIPGYQLLREIHRGGQGVVYQALQKSPSARSPSR
jgi:hypothetical protein